MLPVTVVAAGRAVSQATPAMTPTLVPDTTVTQGSRLSCLGIVDVVDTIDIDMVDVVCRYWCISTWL